MVQVTINSMPLAQLESTERIILVDIIKNANTPDADQKVKEINFSNLTAEQKAVYEAFEALVNTLANL